MKPKNYFLVSVVLVAWCVFWPCCTSQVNESARQETARFQIRVFQENGRILQDTQQSIDAARRAFDRAEKL